MSASRERKKRMNQPEVVVTEAPKKKGMSKGLKRVLTVVVAAVLIAAIVFLGMVSTGFFQKYTTAAVANGHKLTPAMVNYFYANAYTQMQSYMGTLLDTSIPLSEQEYTGDEYDTWADYMLDYAVSTAANTYAIYDEAVANGHTLSAEAQATIASELEMVDAYSTMYGFANGNSFLAGQYGMGCNMKNYEEYLTVNMMASDYSASIADSLTYTQEEIDARYNANPQAYDGVTYHFLSLTPDMFPDAEDGMAAAEEAAKTIAEASEGDVDTFMSMASDYTTATTLREDYTVASCAEAYREWIADEARQEGDVMYAANGDTGYVVVYFIQHEDHNFQMPVVRHILVGVSDTTDAEAMAAAEEEANAILDEFLAGEQTEQAFADLALVHSDDNGEEGGLIEGIAPGVMVVNFEDWAYAPHEIGDTGVIETEYGYHVMYFNGYGETYHNYMIESAMMNEDFSAWNTEVTGDVTYTVNESASRYIVDL